MRFTLTIDSNGDDAIGNPRGLVNMVLTDVAAQVREYVAYNGSIRDGNGNLVGTWMLNQGYTGDAD